MGKFIKSVLSNFLAGLLLLGGPVTVLILARLQSIPWYLVALAVMAAPGIVFWSYLQVKAFWRLRRQTIERSGQIIREWLDHTRLNVANDPVETAYYRYTVTQGSSRKVSVFRLKDDPEFVSLGINMLIPPTDYKALDTITSSPKSTLIRDLRIELARLGIEFAGLKHPLRIISFTDSMVFDQNLTRPAFFQKVLFMFRAQVIVSELISAEGKSFGVSLGMDASQIPSSQLISQKEVAGG